MKKTEAELKNKVIRSVLTLQCMATKVNFLVCI